MTNQTEAGEPQERQDINSGLKFLSTTLGALLIIGVLTVVALHVSDKEAYPKPTDIEAGLLLGIGVVLLLVFYLPWTKIRVGDIEIERALEEQSIDHAEEVTELKKVIGDLEGLISDPGGKIPDDIKEHLERTKTAHSQEDKDTKLLLDFLDEWPSWGFTATRIKNFTRDKAKYERLSKLEIPRIRSFAANLIKEGKIRTRVSQKGNILYQSNQ